MVKINKIYTRTGDGGETGLGDGSRVQKHALRVTAYGEVDEANAVLGLVLAVLREGEDTAALGSTLLRIQNDLFDVGADLCVPESPGEEACASLRVTSEQVATLEKDIDRLNADLSPLTSFVLPSGSPLASHLHHARTVIRRAERAITALMDHETVNTHALTYMNRLSDLLFVMARVANNGGEDDVLWTPGANR